MTPTDTLIFSYDENGKPAALTYNGNTYYYVTTQQGDVMYIVDGSNNIKASYTYNAWGEIISSSGELADVNPIRYRGYYYDAETGLYYLQSRYYDPVICRFINADKYASTGQDFLGFNMFAYCGNNPVNNSDPDGLCPYDGSVCDFRRLERGLPPRNCKCAKKQVNQTLTVGVTGKAAFGVDGSVSIGLAVDSKGNIGIIKSIGLGGGTPSASFSVFEAYTNAPDIEKLKGASTQIGGSIDFGASVGVDGIFFKNQETNENYYGNSVSVGIGVGVIPFEFHSEVVNSDLVTINNKPLIVNIFDFLEFL